MMMMVEEQYYKNYYSLTDLVSETALYETIILGIPLYLGTWGINNFYMRRTYAM